MKILMVLTSHDRLGNTGKPTGMPATEPVPVYPVKIEDDDVLVAIEES